MERHRRGFTLLELMIVAAIIAILAVIAIPNFLEAQTRSRVAQVRLDQATLGTALESYRVDGNNYPPEGNPNVPAQGVSENPDAGLCLLRLTTPVAYLGGLSAAECPFLVRSQAFAGNGHPIDLRHFFYTNYRDFAKVRVAENARTVTVVYHGWGLSSLGPDRTDNGILWDPVIVPNQPITPNNLYDPSNGTVSHGDIPRFGGEVPSAVSGELNPR